MEARRNCIGHCSGVNSVNWGDVSLLELECIIGDQCVQSMVDSGATHNFISAQLVKRLNLKVQGGKLNAMQVRLANGSVVSATGIVTAEVSFSNTLQQQISFVVVPELSYETILGIPWLKTTNPNIHWACGLIEFGNGQSIWSRSLKCASGTAVTNTEQSTCPKIEIVSVKRIFKDLKQKDNVASWLGVLQCEGGGVTVQEATGLTSANCKIQNNSTVHCMGMCVGKGSCDVCANSIGHLGNSVGNSLNVVGNNNGQQQKLADILPACHLVGIGDSVQNCLSCDLQCSTQGNCNCLLRKTDNVRACGIACDNNRGIDAEADCCGSHAVTGQQQQYRSQFDSAVDDQFRNEIPKNPKFEAVLDSFPEVFGTPGMPPDREVKHRIDLVDENAKPPPQRMYRMSQPELAELKRQIDALLEKGWIKPSASPYGSPVLFVKKKTGELRMCVDYRMLNKQTRLDKYPIPRIDSILDSLAGAKVFSLVDLRSGYHQVQMEPGHEFKTAFCSRFGNYQFQVMPFGLCNAPSTFQRLMNSVFHKHLDDFVTVYLDDILVFSKDEDDHVKHLTWVFQQMKEHQLFAKRSKCDIGLRSVKYLGHVIENGSVRMDPDKIVAVRDWPQLQSQKHVQQFLGLCNYYNRFISGFSQISAPLSELCGSKVPFVWGDRQQQAFRQLKDALCTAPVLRLPDWNRDFIIETDASDLAIGAVLQQQFDDGLYPIAYFSKKLNSAERNYPVHEREQFAIVSAVLKWRCYIDGRVTTVVTDHASLVHLQSQPNLSKRQIRWMEKLSDYKLDIQYRPGSKAVVPDALSRMPGVEVASEGSVDSDVVVDGIVGKLNTITCEPGWLARVHRESLKCPDLQLSWKLGRSSSEKVFIRVVDGMELLYRRVQYGSDNTVDLLIIPSTGGLRLALMRELHDTNLSAHLGVNKTLEALKCRVWWPKMSASVKSYVRSCPVCQRVKDSTQRAPGELQPLPIPSESFESWSMDFITNLPMSNGYNGIFTCVDRLTKLVRVRPCTIGESQLSAGETASLFFNAVIRDFGCPKSIVSDRDPRFTSAFWRALMEMMGTKLAFSTAFHPQSDGQTERAHRTLEQTLRSLLADRDDCEWSDYLGHAEFAINSTCSASTKFSPFELVYGKKVAIPTDRLDGLHRVQAAQDVVDGITQLIDRAKSHLSQAQQYQKNYYDSKHTPISFEVGQQVLLSTQNLKLHGSRKFTKRYIGPFVIVKKIGKQAYQLQLSQQLSRLHPVFHISLLKEYVKPLTQQVTPVGGVVLDDDGDVQYEVEKVLRHRTFRRTLQFLVKWKGYPVEEATWEPEQNLANATRMVEAYWKRSQG